MCNSFEIAELCGLRNSVKIQWTIGIVNLHSLGTVFSPEFELKLVEETQWKLIACVSGLLDIQRRFADSCFNGRKNMKFGLKNVNGIKSSIMAIMNFEIRNESGKLYFKDSVVHCFSKLNEEHFSEEFVVPSYNFPVRGTNTDIYFDSGICVKGNVVVQDIKKHKSLSEPQCKGNVVVQDIKKHKSLSEPQCKNTSQLQLDLKRLLQSNMFSDVEFHIGNEVIRAHRSILSSRSIVFQKLFEQNMKEKESKSVKITDIEKQIFEVFLAFVYTGEVQDKKIEIIMPLYSTADKYSVDTLFETCSRILTNYISDETVSDILRLADMHNDPSLKASAIDFICKNFPKVEVTNAWDNLLNSDPRLASYTLKQVSIRAARTFI